MQLDKFLKVSRLVKRRTVANELCDNGNVTLDGHVAKAANVVRPGQRLTLHLGNRTLSVDINQVPEGKAVSAQQTGELYTVLSDTRQDTPL